MSLKFFSRLFVTGLVLSYPFLAHWMLPRWPMMPNAALTMFPALLNAWLAWIFGRTLQSGCEPLISTFARLEREKLLHLSKPELLGDMARHTRMLTQLWTGLFIAMALMSALLSLAGQLAWWAVFTGIVSYLLVATLYIGEYIYRRLHFPHYPHANPLRLAWFLAKSGPLWMHRAT